MLWFGLSASIVLILILNLGSGLGLSSSDTEVCVMNPEQILILRHITTKNYCPVIEPDDGYERFDICRMMLALDISYDQYDNYISCSCHVNVKHLELPQECTVLCYAGSDKSNYEKMLEQKCLDQYNGL